MTEVAVNLLWLIPGVVGGSEEYTVGLLRAAHDREPSDLRLRIFGQPSLFAAYPDLADRFETTALPRDISMKPARFALECSWLAAQLWRKPLVHHGGGVVPLTPSQRVVVTVHDLQPLELPSNFSSGQQRWFRVMLPRAARVADGVITPSAFTADRMASVLGYARERVRVVPPVHDPIAADDSAPAAIGDGRFLLFPAIAHPHKRHRDAVEALHLLRDTHPDLRLIFTGGPGAESDHLRSLVAQRDLASRVDVRGRVPSSELDQLLRSAAVMVFPSLYEGFGNPVLEAMSRGTPVVAADIPALREVAGEAALLVEPRNPSALADAIARILDRPAVAEELIAAGKQRANGFTGEVAGHALLDAYRDALA